MVKQYMIRKVQDEEGKKSNTLRYLGELRQKQEHARRVALGLPPFEGG